MLQVLDFKLIQQYNIDLNFVIKLLGLTCHSRPPSIPPDPKDYELWPASLFDLGNLPDKIVHTLYI